ncbi:MAG: GntR family transcriptional regulator [Rhizobiaceae bacterium]
MTQTAFNSWQTVQDEVLRRISLRQWKPGDIIPNEEELSREFGCARTTVNRALRNLAQAGLLDRRRKAGTRIAIHPVRKATLEIPVIRREIEGKSLEYGYSLLTQEMVPPPPQIATTMQTGTTGPLLHLLAVHKADARPYVYEDRWINPATVPDALKADFTQRSPNEWLVSNIPFEGGDIAFSAIAADARDASILQCKPGEGLFVIDRTTWSQDRIITSVRLTFCPGYRMQTEL